MLFGASFADAKLASGTSVPGLSTPTPPSVPVSGLTQRMSLRSRPMPVGPLVFSHSPKISDGLAGSAKLIHDRMQPVWSGERQAGKPSEGRSALTLIGQPTT